MNIEQDDSKNRLFRQRCKDVKTSSLLVLRSLSFATLWAVDDPGLPSWQKSSAITGGTNKMQGDTFPKTYHMPS